jgi:ubiquinone biosynthesis protein Coq4
MQKQLADIYSILTGSNTQAMSEIGIAGFVLLMLVSLVSSLIAAFLYLQFYASRATGSQVHRAFPLLAVSITAIFVAIQFSLPLSLGLLGALSIVRFRTPIKEPEEIGFIMLVIATSIACATYKLAFVGLILVVATVALLLQ